MNQASGAGRRATHARSFKSTVSRGQRFAAILALISMLSFSFVPANAATNTWTAGSNTDFNWDTVTNWSLGIKPVATSDVVFPTPIPSATPLITLGAGELANSLTFNDAYTLSGGDLTLSVGLDANSGSVNVANAITAQIDSLMMGTGVGLTKVGGGTLVLTNANTFDGPVVISGGILSTNQLGLGGSASGIGQSSNLASNLILNGGTLQYTGTTASLTDRLFTLGAAGGALDSSGTGSVVFANSDPIAYGGAGTRTLTLTGTSTGANSVAMLIANNGADAVSVVKTGTGTWALAGNNTYTGGTTLTGGALSIASQANIGGATAAITFNGGNLQVTGTGLTSIDTNTVNWGTFNGGFDIADAANTFSTNQTINVAAGGKFAKTGLGSMQLNGAGSNTGPVVVNLGALLLNKTGGADAVGTAGLTVDITGFPTNTGEAVARLQAANQVNDAAVVTVRGGDTGNRARFDLAGFNETIGGLVVSSRSASGGGVVSTGTGILTVNGDILLANNRVTGTNNGRELLITGDVNQVGGSNYISSGTLDLGGATRTITVDPTDPNALTTNSDGTIEAVIQNGGIVKMGNSRLRLSGTNTFSGGLTVNQGVVGVMTGDANLGAANNVITLNGGGIASGFNTLGSIAQYTAAATRKFNIGANGGIFEVISTNANPSTNKILLPADTLVGSSNITKLGGGDLQLLSTQNQYTGTWTINAGVVEAQNNQSLGTGAVTVNAGGELTVTTPANVGNTINLAGGTIGANGNGGTAYSGPINVSANSTIAARFFHSTGNGVNLGISGPITSSSRLTIIGNTGTNPLTQGVVSLTNNNTGLTGTIQVNTNAQLRPVNTPTIKGAGTAAIVLAGGSLDLGPGAVTPGATAGFNGRYYNSPLITNGVIGGFDFPNAGNLLATRNDATINFSDLTQAAQRPPIVAQTQLGVLWQGVLNITNAGNYRFFTASDDGSLLYIDGQPVVFNDAAQGVTERAGGIDLTSGAHSIIVKYGQGAGGTAINVNYQGLTAAQDGGGAKIIVGSLAGSVTNNGSGLFPDATPFSNDITLSANTNSTINLAGSNGSLTGPVTFENGAGLTFSGITGYETLSINGPVQLNGGNTFGVGYTTLVTGLGSSGTAVVNTGITEAGGGSGFTKVGSGTLRLNGNNTYSGQTIVNAGLLELNAPAGGTAIPGDLTVSAPTGTFINTNVRLLASNQIADTATVNMQSGVLDIDGKSDTILRLNLTGGTVTGTTGTLTVTDLASSLFSGGSVLAKMTGTGDITISGGAGIVTFGGNNSFTGNIGIQGGAILRVGNGSTSALGIGGTTTIASGGQLQFSGNSSVTGVDINGFDTGISNDGVIRNVSGVNTYTGNVFIATPTVLQSDFGRLTFAAGGSFASQGNLTIQGAGDIRFDVAPNTNGGQIIKNGAGALILGTPQTSATLANVQWNDGILGFAGLQNFGAFTVPTGKAIRFESDPGAGVSVTTNAGSSVIAGYNAGTELVSRITGGSDGALLLGVNGTNNLNFTSTPNLTFGADKGIRYYGGTITPGANGYNLGGGNGQLVLTAPLTAAGALNVSGNNATIDLTQTRNTFTGGINLKGGRLKILNNQELGDPANAITFNGGTLQALTAWWANQNGSLVNTLSRNIVMNGAGTIDTPNATNVVILPTSSQTMTGSGAFTKTGLGSLFILNPSAMTGAVTVASQGGILDVRSNGSLANISSLTLGQNTDIRVDNQNGLNSFIGSQAIPNRLSDTAPISLEGGRLFYVGKNVALNVANHTSDEVVGAITVARGFSEIRSERNGNGGADVVAANLIRTYQSDVTRTATLNFTAGNTLSQFGDNGRVILNLLNGTAPTAGQFIGGWAVRDSTDFTVYGGNSTVGGVTGTSTGVSFYGATGSTAYTTLSSAATPGTGGFLSGNVGNTNNVDITIGTAGTPANFTLRALRISGATSPRQLLFANSNDTLFVESGGILRDNVNNSSAIGTTALPGILTAGSATAGTLNTPQELFFHNNQNTMTVNSQIVDNPVNALATVRVVKDEGGTVTITSANNTYSGGTAVLRGALNATQAGGLGTGPVYVRNSTMTLSVPGAVSGSNGMYTVDEKGEIFLSSTTLAYNTPSDRFSIGSGSTISLQSVSGGGIGANSLTRVSGTPVNGGEIFLAPDSIVRHNAIPNAPNVGTGVFTVNNLGTNADLFFSPAGGTGALSTLTIGTGTPWKGLSSSTAAATWASGTIIANSDFVLQGLQRDNGFQTLNLGGGANLAPFQIVNATQTPINAFVTGNLTLAGINSPTISPDITFVLGPNATMFANVTSSFGAGQDLTKLPKVLVQAGGNLDPGNFVGVGSAVGMPAGFPLAVPGPLNADITVEAGGRFLLNDPSGLGTAPVGAIKFKKDSVMQFESSGGSVGGNLLTGANNGLINDGQLVFDPGAIIRYRIDSVVNMDRFVNNAPNGDKLVYEIFDANRTITNQVNVQFNAVTNPNANKLTPENLILGNGGMLTNDSASRNALGGYGGRIVVNNGGIFAATTTTTFSVNDDFDLAAGATLVIGNPDYIDSNQKLGLVAISSTNNQANNRMGAGSMIQVISGAQLQIPNQTFGGVSNVIPDVNGRIDLPVAVTTPALFPTSGSSLRLSSGGIETISQLTGPGMVTSDTANSVLAVGAGNVDTTFAGVFSSAGTQQPNLAKVGTGTLHLTGTSTSTGTLTAYQGTIAIDAAGNSTQFTAQAARGGTILVDDSTNAGGARLKNVSSLGGTIRVLGGAANVTETVNQFNSGGIGGTSFVQVEPGAGTTNLLITTFQNFNNANATGVYVLRGAGMGGTPGTPATNGTIGATNANLTMNGATNQNLAANATISGGVGSVVMGMRPDVLVDTSLTGNGTGFGTQDGPGTGFRALAASEYSGAVVPGGNLNSNILVSGTQSFYGDTRVQSLTLDPGSTIDGTGLTPNTTTSNRLTVTSSGILARGGGTSTINVPYLDRPTNQGFFFHTLNGAVLNVNAVLQANQGIVKSGSGTLNLSAGALNNVTGALTINDGTVNLGTNTSLALIAPTNGGFYTGQNVNANGGLLRLNGNSQIINALNSANPLPGMGGVISSTSAATLNVQGGGVFSGRIDGNISLSKVNNNTLSLTGLNEYSGTTFIKGGTLQLRDSGRLQESMLYEINYGTLALDNGNYGNINDRVSPAAVLNLRGGTVTLLGAVDTVSTQTFGTVNLVQGGNIINANATALGSADITIGNLNRSTGSIAFFQTQNGILGAPTSDKTSPHIFLNQLNGNAFSQNSLVNGIIGGWAVVNGSDFATYVNGQGVGALGNVAAGFANYSTNALTAAAATDNITIAANPSANLNNTTVNSLRITAASTVTMNSGQTLTLASGGLLLNGASSTITGGNLTSGGPELFATVSANTLTVASVITGPISLVKTGGSTLTLTGNNTYTGTTYANNGTLTLNTASGNGNTTVAVPGDLVINGAGNVTTSVTGQIKSTANVTLNGSASLTVNGAALTETVRSITFNGIGGIFSGNTANSPIINGAGTVAITNASAITSISDNAASIPTFSSSLAAVNFAGADGTAQTINVSGPIQYGLLINGNINDVPNGVPNGGLVKTGPGILALGGSGSTFGGVTSAIDVQQGFLRVDNNGALGPITAVTAVEPTGTLIIGGQGGAANVVGGITLKGGTLGATIGTAGLGAAATPTSTLTLATGTTSTVNLYDFQQQTIGRTITVNSNVVGSGDLILNGPGIAGSTGTFRLGNLTPAGNTLSGNITINPTAILLAQSNPATAASTGNLLGTATINLSGGALQLRDDNSLTYNNMVRLNTPSTIDVNRANATATNQIITVANLVIPAGSPTLTVTGGNGYSLGVNVLDGPGNLIKGGGSTAGLTVAGVAPTFTGNIGVAAATGVNGLAGYGGAVNAGSSNTQGGLNIAANTIPGLDIGGGGVFVVPASKTLNITNTLNVGDSYTVVNGTNNVNKGAVTGMLSIPNTATVTAATVANNGIIGSTGGNTTLTAGTAFVGRGLYQTNGQPLTLNGVLADNGPTPTILKVAGNSVVNITPGASSTSTGGAEVQSGTLRVAPTAAVSNPLGTGTIKVLGVPASALGAGSQPVAGVAAELQFDSGANAVSLTNNITNSGLVHVKSGTTTVAGTISGTPVSYAPGLLEGVIASGTLDASTARPANPGQFGIKLEPRMAQTNINAADPVAGWNNNTTFVYTGQFFDADGKFTFAENIDDNVMISVDGVTRLLSNTGTNPWQTVTATSSTFGQRGGTVDTQTGTAPALVNGNTAGNVGGAPATDFGMGPNGDGWHTIEIRLTNGGGGAGPAVGNGFNNNYGLGLNTAGTTVLDGAAYTRPIDPGDGSLFRTAVGGSGNIQVDAGATLATAAITQIGTVTLNSDGTNGGTLQLTDKAVTTNSDFNGIVLGGTTGNLVGRLTLGTNNVVSASSLTLPGTGGAITGSKLIVDATPTVGTVGRFNVGSPNLATGSTLQVDGARVTVTGSSVGNGAIVVNNAAALRVDGSVASASSLTVNNTGKFEAGSTQTVRRLNLNDSAVAEVVAGALKVLTVGDDTNAAPLAITGNGKVDVTTNGLIVDYSAGNEATAMQTVRGQIIAGYNGGTWTGNGITSSNAAADTFKAVGYAQASEVAAGGTFLGKTGVDSTSIVVRYTLSGDATLDGSVDFNDLVKLAQNYNTTVSATTESWWANGDFNYDGSVDFNDLVKLAQNYNTALPAGAVPGASVDFNNDLAAAFAAVPEPGSLSVLALAGLALLRRRNRQAA